MSDLSFRILVYANDPKLKKSCVLIKNLKAGLTCWSITRASHAT